MNLEAPLDVIDRMLERWAVSVNGGAPAPWAETVASKPPPLPDDLATEVDQAVLKAPSYYPILLKNWYRKSMPAEVVAIECGLGNRTLVYPALRVSLAYLYGKFETNGVLARYQARSRV